MPAPKTVRIKPVQRERQRSHWVRPGLYVTMGFILLQFILSGCAVGNKSSNLELTPVTESPTEVHRVGKFVWNDLLTDDVAVAKDFYGQLFGWTFEQQGGYTVINNNSQRIGGMAQVGEESGKTGAARWICSLSVADVDKATALVTEEGGTVHVGPLELLNRGRGALVSDPQGAQLLLLYATDGDPEDGEPVLGSWLWHELWSNDTEASLAFYQKLVGYDYEGEKTDYLILLKDEQWRAGIRDIKDSELEMRWVPVVRVADTEETAERAEQLGGKLLVGPRPTASGGSVALLSDPSDALVIIQRWSATTSEQEN
ncbi:MAG: VOC family protein [Desulfuromonadales bacterium]|nr:VOC family protein [Desulfuromonadales bacterium]